MLPMNRTHRTTPGSFINDFLNDDFLPSFFDWNKNSKDSLPAVNVEETNESFIISVAAAGLNKQDFKVTVDGDVLTISSEKEDKKDDKNKAFIRQEFSYNSFSRSFSLPDNTDASKIKASHKNGILNVSIPKVEVEIKKAIDVKIN